MPTGVAFFTGNSIAADVNNSMRTGSSSIIIPGIPQISIKSEKSTSDGHIAKPFKLNEESQVGYNYNLLIDHYHSLFYQ